MTEGTYGAMANIVDISFGTHGIREKVHFGTSPDPSTEKMLTGGLEKRGKFSVRAWGRPGAHWCVHQGGK